MASGALFGSSGSRSQTKNLVEFRAGRMNLKDRMVHPDKRKGLVYIYQADDSLMHFCWKDRTSGQVEDDLIIFPDDIEFKRITQCTTGRCYVLKFKSSVRRFFFWMQEPKSEKDDELCRKVNEYLNNPPNPSVNRNNVSDLPGLGESDLHNILGNMSQQQLMQLLGGMGMPAQNNLNLSTILGRPGSSSSNGSDSTRLQSSLGTRTSSTSSDSISSGARPATATASLTSQTSESTTNNSSTSSSSSTTTTTTSTASSSSGAVAASGSSGSRPGETPWQQIQLSDLQNILSNMQVPGDKAQDSLELSQVLKPDDIIPILANADIQKHLMEHLPEGEVLPRTEEELRNTVKSPQFQQALQSFSAALRSRELGPLMTQFGLGDDVAKAAAEGDLEAFVKALQEAQKKKGDAN